MVTFTINGVEPPFDGDPEMPLLWYLRDELGPDRHQVRLRRRILRRLHRAHRRQGGALVPDRRCAPLAGKQIVTIEGLSPEGITRCSGPGAAQRARSAATARVGQIMQAAALLAREAAADRRRYRRAMAGNICRCGTYQRIRAAIKRAAEARHDA